MKRSSWLNPIFLVYGVLAVSMGMINPLFEAPDEHWHYFTAQYIADNGQLPSVPQPARRAPFVPEIDGDWLGQEAAQPPLYYALAAMVIVPFETANAREKTIHNPFVLLGDAGAPMNRNAFVHSPHDGWPWRGHVLAAQVLRLVSAAIGLGTLWLIDDTGQRLWPNRLRRVHLATALVAILPQFIFLHGSITNDVLIILLATWVLRELVVLFQERQNGLFLRDYVKLGVLCGLAMLTKNQGIILLGFTGLVIIGRWLATRSPINQHPTPHPLLGALVSGLLSLVFSSWLYWRNWSLYGDPTATNQFIIIAGGDRGFSLGDVLAELPGLWLSSFGVFGWFNVRLPDVFYTLWTAGVIVAVVGAIWGLSLQTWPKSWRDWLLNWPLWLAFWVVLVLTGLISFAMQTPAMQGRLLFPAIMPLALGLAYGFDNFYRFLAQKSTFLEQNRRLFYSPLLVPLITSLAALSWIVPQEYEPPRADQISTQPVELTFGDFARLENRSVFPPIAADSINFLIELQWLAMAETTINAIEFAQLIKPNGERFAGVDTFHGGGLYPTSLWGLGETVVDTVYIELPALDPNDPAGCFPAGLGLDIGLYTTDGPILSELGEATTRLATVRRDPYAGEDIDCRAGLPQSERYQLAETVLLTGYTLSETAVPPGEPVTLMLVWEVLNAPEDDYTVFLQLLDGQGEIAAQFDGPPLGGTLPTGLWRAGDLVPDERVLALPADLPAGTYTLVSGWYRPDDFYRLPAVDNSGERQPNDAIILGTIEVRP
ncbi:MAG: hypothetical protein QNJ45_02705 [Ardenticatenaceae bacterium]|nr:hypothetical protein [Ardenticatenaceae bacterium]